MRSIKELQQAGLKLGYANADLRAFVKEQQAIEQERDIAERVERAAARAQRKLEAEKKSRKR